MQKFWLRVGAKKKNPAGDLGAKNSIILEDEFKKNVIFFNVNPWNCGSCVCPGVGMGYFRGHFQFPGILEFPEFHVRIGEGFPPLEGAVVEFQRGWSWDSSGI